MTPDGRVSSSFRDPSDELSWQDGVLLRRINPDYLTEFNRLTQCGLSYQLLEGDLPIPY